MCIRSKNVIDAINIRKIVNNISENIGFEVRRIQMHRKEKKKPLKAPSNANENKFEANGSQRTEILFKEIAKQAK